MNAGGEYVVYRICAALQDRNGIHPESLLTCLGALAGYACQACVRETAALPGADPAKYQLREFDTSDGTTYLEGDALKLSLVENPLSVWSLVSCTVRKLDEPLPDIQGIVRHVSATVGTDSFGVPRSPDGHGPRHPAIFYLRQVWPQILPIAQRFCRKPTQVPMLFGIALQRAIEMTHDALSPTLGASIAMESAVAMSKVVLPEAETDRAVTAVAAPAAIAPVMRAPPRRSAALSALGSEVDSLFIRAPARKRKPGDEVERRPRIRAFVASIPPAARLAAIAFLAFISIAGAMYKGNRGEARDNPRQVRQLVIPKSQESANAFQESTQESTQESIPESTQEAQTMPDPPPPQEREAAVATPAPAEPAEYQPIPDSPPANEPPPSDGSSEIVIPDS